MRMVPSTPHATPSSAELRVFDKLRAFRGQGDEHQVAYHSLNLPRHAYKRWGEIDFLVCSQKGILVLEVKGGQVKCTDGVWEFTNRFGETTRKNESPFRQAETAMHGLRRKLEDEFGSMMEQFTFGYGVILPDSDWQVRGAEWDPPMVVDSMGFKDFDRWLDGLFAYWNAKPGNSKSNRQASEPSLKRLRDFIRPEVDVAIPLHVQTRDSEEAIASLTADQLHFVDAVELNPRVMCSGGAGTGKTFLALELARRWSSQGMEVALACRSKWLKTYLQAVAPIPRLTITLASGIREQARRAGVSKFDALIVDEGQDLLDMDHLDLLDAALEGGLANGRWCFFHDSNNQSGFFAPLDPEAIQLLDGYKTTTIPLKTNCRNTRPILEEVKRRLGADMGVRGAGDGPNVREFIGKSREQAVMRLEQELRTLIQEGGLSPVQITILSAQSMHQSIASSLPDAIRNRICLLDAATVAAPPPDKVTFSEVSNFKGLENSAVILIDINPTTTEKNTMYVGMSRAKAVLSMIIFSGNE